MLATAINIKSKNTLGVKKGAIKNLKKGWDKKELKSKWAAKASVADKNKILIITIQAAKY